MKTRLPMLDVAMMTLLLIFIVLFAIVFVDFTIAPFEDAAILMRYADHFAHGHGIVWNIGEKPVDGATDFLFMIVLGLLTRTGMSLEFAVRFVGFSSHIITIYIIYVTSRRIFSAGILPSLIPCLYFAVGPGLYYVAAFFGTPFFALFAAITWYYALCIVFSRQHAGTSSLFVLSAFIMSLIRPEGVLLSGLMVLAVLFIIGRQKSLRTILIYITVFFILGGAYFIWRWRYFGYPLPNPFYRKGGGNIYVGSLKSSIGNTIRMCLPFLVPFVAGIWSRRTLRLTVGFSMPIIGFACAFILLSNEMNFGARFQYALLPLVLMSWWPLAGAFKDDVCLPEWSQLDAQKRLTTVLLALTLSVGVVGYQFETGRVGYSRDGRFDIANMLSEYADRDFTIATSEAGLLPLYSRWNAIDTWGLNDQWISHHGAITNEYLGSFQPHLIVFHAYFSPLGSQQRQGDWSDMITTLKSYAEANDYVLAAAFGDSPYETHYYYVRSDFPESQEITGRIRATDYIWYTTGSKAIDYASLTAN